jgi:hypothetical protein
MRPPQPKSAVSLPIASQPLPSFPLLFPPLWVFPASPSAGRNGDGASSSSMRPGAPGTGADTPKSSGVSRDNSYVQYGQDTLTSATSSVSLASMATPTAAGSSGQDTSQGAHSKSRFAPAQREVGEPQARVMRSVWGGEGRRLLYFFSSLPRHTLSRNPFPCRILVTAWCWTWRSKAMWT